MSWEIKGASFETCSCDVAGPRTASLALGADYDRRRVTLVFHVASGDVDGADVSGLTVAAVTDTPKVMSDGNWRLGVRWLAGGTLLVAAGYEFTPLKEVCLSKCRSPLGFLLGSWRDGLTGALNMGARHGAWCVGCCWALMAALFALGVMSVTWMAFVAALITLEKTLPWDRPVTHATAVILVVLGVLLLAAPDAVPGLTIPGDGSMGGGSMSMR